MKNNINESIFEQHKTNKKLKQKQKGEPSIGSKKKAKKYFFFKGANFICKYIIPERKGTFF